MKNLICLVLFLSAAFLLKAQPFTDFAVISQEERQLKECEFDKEAEAIYLLHDAVSTYNDEYNMLTEHHVRIKILKEKGIGYADISIPFYSDGGFENISNIVGLVINFDEDGNRNEFQLDKKTIFYKKINKYRSIVTFALPSVKVGSIIEYQYRSTMKNYGGLDDWNFQEKLPVKKSSYLLSILPNYEFTYLFHKDPSRPVDVKNNSQTGQVYFEMKNIPGLGDEPYMDARKDYLQRVVFKLSGHNTARNDGYAVTSTSKTKFNATWNQVIHDFLGRNDFGNQLGKNLDGVAYQTTVAKAMSGDAEKIKFLLNFVRSRVSWNGIHSIVSPDGLKSAWSKKTGTNAEINLIFINLAREAGLDVYPLMVSERHNGSVNKDYPSIDQFNAVYTMIESGNKKYYLDVNDRATPLTIIPLNILNTTALLMNKKSGGLVSITDEAVQYRDFVNIAAEVTKDGDINGAVFMGSRDYARIERLEQYRQDKAKYLDRNFQKNIPGIVIDSFSIKNEESDSLPLQQQFSFHYPAQKTGDYIFLNTNLFSGFEKNPFVASNRFTNVNFGYRQTINLNINIQLPANLAIDAIPKSLKLVNVENTIIFTRQVIKDDENHSLLVQISIELKKSLYTTDEYDSLKEFYSRMFSILDEQIVLKKK